MIGQAILEGIATGLILSVFVGPIFFTMLQLGVEHGFKAAFALALGQWASDFLFIFLAFYSAVFVQKLVDDPVTRETFVWYSGTIGGILLMLFGLALILTKSVSTKGDPKLEKVLDEVLDDIKTDKISEKKSKLNWHYLAYFSQGFLINTINPTPLLFWMSLMAAGVSRSFPNGAIYATYATVMLVVILTDLAKIYLAKSIKDRLKPSHILSVRRLAGTVLSVFGLILIVKVTLL